MNKIIALIPAKNEEQNIARCIKSVLWCDEVIVLWMGNDKTKSIAEKLGAKVISINKSIQDNFIFVQKNINWAIDNIKSDWILRIDADEVVTDELQKEIKKVISYKLQVTNPVAYGIPRAQYFNGSFLKGGDWAYDRLIRLFRPEYCHYEPLVSVHEQFKVNGKISYFKNKLLHYSHPTLKDARKKFQKYTDMEARNLKETNISALFKMIFLPIYIFFRWIIWHNGWKDGINGIIAGIYRGWYEFLIYFKFLKLKKYAKFK